MKNRWYVLVTLVVSLILTPITSQAIDPCSFISQTDAAEILGEGVKSPVTRKTTGFAVGTSCTYYTSAPLAKRGATGSLSLIVYDAETMKAEGGMFTSPEKYFKQVWNANESKANSKIKAIDGIGNQAYWQGGIDRLHLLANGLYLILDIKDLTKISSDKGRDDLNAKISEHRLKKCQKATHDYLLPKLSQK